jgi:Tfp pilus tip-associated adhesin PilY1
MALNKRSDCVRVAGTTEKIRKRKLCICLITIGILLLFLDHVVCAGCLDISSSPLDTKVTSASPNIMFVLDNSGSMDWEFMVEGGNDGLFQVNGTSFEYVFDDPGDNEYSERDSNGTILKDANRGYWKSQWAGCNQLYYNPAIDYQPWPTMSDADPSNPRSNPNNVSPTFDLTAEYLSITNAVIVDNLDLGFAMSSGWGTNAVSDDYGDDYHYINDTMGNHWAKWTPGLPAAGTYEIFAWWYALAERRTDVSYTIYHNGETATFEDYNQQEHGGQWNSLGSFAFSGDGTEYVQINATVAGVSTYCADAVKFVPASATPISIKNAHYYTWDDVNGDGNLDPGETVYLVNFVGGAREYYQVNDGDGDANVESGELVSITDLPASVKPKVYADDGTVIRDKTDAEDLQNFANWYSYYRRRELTAKAAVGNVISGLEGVQVGFYSINSGLRQTVLPVQVDMAASVIVDNQDSGYQETGTWNESGSPKEFRNSSRYTTQTGASATWTPNLPNTGTYRVYAWWNCYSNRDGNAKFTIIYDGGTDTVYKNQRSGGTDGCGEWVELGAYTFAAGTSGSVTSERHAGSTGSSTCADAVMFEEIDGSTVNVDETGTLLNLLYGMDSSGGTPLRNALLNVGRYYHQNDGSDGNLGSSPYSSMEEGGACQQAFAIVMTDGYYNGSSPSVGNQDGDQGAPYADSYSNTLADVAMQYYKNDLSSGLDNEVPSNSCDSATHQHMVTYSVSFGVNGTLTPVDSDGDGLIDDPCFLDSATPIPTWPNPTSGDSQKIDDLWHTAVNGRGDFYSASNPQELIGALEELFENIVSRMASGASVAVNGDELETDTVLYQASYDSTNWTGEMTAYPVDPVTGEIKREDSDIIWKAGEELQGIAWDSRKIVTYNGTDAGTPFRYDYLTTAQKDALSTDPAVAADMVDYLRGKEIDGFRPRTRKLGDIVHSAPLLMSQTKTIFAGGNDGMMHAFNAEDGVERFAYIPNLVFSNLADLTALDYQHRFFVDLTPVAVEGVGAGAIVLLIGGLGAGGKGYYALDVTNAETVSSETDVANMVWWEFPNAGTSASDSVDLGYTYSRAFIVKSYSPAHEWVVIFGNGYDSTNGHAVLFILDVDGTLVKKIDTGVGACNGLSTPSVVDVNNDYKADYAYAGDLKGNLWKFDLTDPDPNNWAVAFQGGAPQPLFQATGQPITTKPDVMKHCERHGYMVLFGTGRYLGNSDRLDTNLQTIYGIWDYGDYADDSEYLGSFDRGTGILSNQPSEVTLLEQTEIDWRSVSGHELRTLSNNTANWATSDDADSEQKPNPSASVSGSDGLDNDGDGSIDEADEQIAHAGWYFDLPLAGERVIKDLIIRDRKAIVISSLPSDSPCSGGGTSIVHEMDACTGGRLAEAQFDINGDNVIDQNDLINIGTEADPVWVAPTGKSFTGMLHRPIMLRLQDGEREMKVFSTSAGTTDKVFEKTETMGVSSWREIVD